MGETSTECDVLSVLGGNSVLSSQGAGTWMPLLALEMSAALFLSISALFKLRTVTCGRRSGVAGSVIEGATGELRNRPHSVEVRIASTRHEIRPARSTVRDLQWKRPPKSRMKAPWNRSWVWKSKRRALGRIFRWADNRLHPICGADYIST